MGEARKDAVRLVFNQKLKLEFHGTKVTSNAGTWRAEFVGKLLKSRCSYGIIELELYRTVSEKA
jgi:hypothetical protein